MQFEQLFRKDINRAYYHDSSPYTLTPSHSPFPFHIHNLILLLCDFCLLVQDEFFLHNFYNWFRSLGPDKFSSVFPLMKQVYSATSRLSPPHEHGSRLFRLFCLIYIRHKKRTPSSTQLGFETGILESGKRKGMKDRK
jgi:hypothetical protein